MTSNIQIKKSFWAGALMLAALIVASLLNAPPPQSARAQFLDQSTYGGTSTGSANAQAITIANYSANTPGVVLRFVPGFINTGPTTLNVSGIGAVALVRPSSIGNVALSGNELQTGELTCVTYNGTAYQLSCNVDMTPIGRTVEFRGSATPRGTLIEDGSCVSRTTYAPLFSVIGTTYSPCDGSTTFGVPDSRGSMFAALDNQGVNGSANRITSGGSGCNGNAIGLCGHENVTLTLAQLPPGITSAGANTITVFPSNNNLLFVPVSSGSTTELIGSLAGGTAPFPAHNPGSTWVGVSNFIGSNLINTTSNNTSGSAHIILNPISLGRRAIKF